MNDSVYQSYFHMGIFRGNFDNIIRWNKVIKPHRDFEEKYTLFSVSIVSADLLVSSCALATKFVSHTYIFMKGHA